jgi:hypothetical protein
MKRVMIGALALGAASITPNRALLLLTWVFRHCTLATILGFMLWQGSIHAAPSSLVRPLGDQQMRRISQGVFRQARNQFWDHRASRAC